VTQVITTFSRDGFDLYGRRMVNSWLQYWPANYGLTVYTEGFSLPDNARIQQIELTGAAPGLTEFKSRSQELIQAQPDNKKYHRRVQKTVKWCHKVYAMSHALHNATTGHVIFLDGDTYSKAAVPESLARDLVGTHLFAVHFEKLKHGLHFETGLVVFNTRHQQMPAFVNEITRDYDNLNIYNHNKTWDSYWFAHLYHTMNLDVRDLTERGQGVFGNRLVKNCLAHEVGTEKYARAGYNKFTGTKI